MVTYAVDAVSGIALVCVLAQAVLALCDAQGGGGDDLVEGVWAAREDFARVAMANNRNLSVFAIQQVSVREKVGMDTYQRMWPCCSLSSLAVHSVLPQWHFPWYEDMIW
jgi:hypothetical protein